MFEHLGPKIHSIDKTRPRSFGTYVGLLILAIFVFTVSVSAQSERSNLNKPESAFLTAGIAVNQYDQTIVAKISRVSLFDFVINPTVDGALLKKVEIKAYGLYDEKIFSGINLVHEGAQIARPSHIDEYGNIIFELSDYKINRGDNSFSVVLDNDNILKSGDLIQMSFLISPSVTLSYNGHTFFAKQNGELKGGSLSVVDAGKITVTNNLPVKIYAVSQKKQVVVDFLLKSLGETVDLRQISLYVQYPNDADIDDVRFSLWRDNREVSYGYVQDHFLTFDFQGPLPIAASSPQKLSISANDLKSGDYLLAIENISVGGYSSGQPVEINKAEYNQQVTVVAGFPQLKITPTATKFSDGWNTLYEVELASAGQTIRLDQLGFTFKSSRVDVEEIQLWVNNSPAVAEVDFTSENKVRFYWPQGLSLSHDKVNIKFLSRLKIRDKNAALQIGLDADSFQWSINNSRYDGKFISTIPKTSNILNSY